MKLNRTQITNFRLFDHLNINFSDSNVNVFIGANGAGKTTILDAIALILAHMVGKLTSDIDSYFIQDSIQKKDIKIGAVESTIEGFYTDNKDHLIINTTKKVNQSGTGYKFDPANYFEPIVNDLINQNTSSLPVIAYYRINRNLFLPKTKESKFYFNSRLEGYENCVNPSISPFAEFENWFINAENSENEFKVSADINYQNPILKEIRNVIAILFTNLKREEFLGLRGRRKSNNPKRNASNIESGLVLLKANEEIAVNSLSSGEKNLILIFADITRRLCLLSNSQDNKLQGHGFVLIDELELHLHPKWQRFIITNLSLIFPNVQFFITTHSPQIISGIKSNELYFINDGELLSVNSAILGRDSNGILEEVFGTSSRPDKTAEIISEIYKAIDNQDQQRIESSLIELDAHTEKEDPILVRIKNLMNRLELI